MRARMRMIARLLLLSTCCLVLFIAGVLVTFKINLLICGAEEFNGNAGAGFGALMEGIFVGVLLAPCGIPVGMLLANRIQWLHD
jgi:hypothetical protein